jgi:hypothetical protein
LIGGLGEGGDFPVSHVFNRLKAVSFRRSLTREDSVARRRAAMAMTIAMITCLLIFRKHNRAARRWGKQGQRFGGKRRRPHGSQNFRSGEESRARLERRSGASLSHLGI